MKTNAILGTICIALIIILGIFWIRFSSVQAPTVDPVVPPPSDTTPPPTVACQGIQINTPIAGAQVTFPLTITGTVHPTGNSSPWIVFEANAGNVVVKDSTGATKSTPKALPISGDWMNSNPKPFSVTIPVLTGTPATNALTLLFSDDDPSGENPHYCSIPVTF